MTSELTPIGSTRDGGVLGHEITVGDRVRIYPGGRYGDVAYIGADPNWTGRVVVGVDVSNTPPSEGTEDAEPDIEEHAPRNLRKVVLADPALKPGDRIRWTAGNGTVRVGTVIEWAEDTGTWLAAIDGDRFGCGYRTWFWPADLVRVEPDGGQ